MLLCYYTNLKRALSSALGKRNTMKYKRKEEDIHNIIRIAIVFYPSLIDLVNESSATIAHTLQDKQDILVKSGQELMKGCSESYLVS